MANGGISGKNVRLILDAVNKTQQHFDAVLNAIKANSAATQQQGTAATIASAAIAQMSANNNLLAASLLQTTNRLQAQTAATQQARQALQQHRTASLGAVGGLGGLRSALLAVQAALATLGVKEAVEALVDANIQFQKIQNGFEAVAGGPEAAAKEFRFVSDEAQRLGLFLPVVAQEYTKLLAAGKPLGFETLQIRKIFTSVAQAAIVLGLSMDDVHGTLRAVQQMMSKGTVQAEELRGQLGERLPGAFALAAKALGTTTAGLGKMLEDGKVLATDLLPKLAIELDKTFGGQVEQASNATARSIDRLRTEFSLFLKQVGDAGLIEALVGAMGTLNAALKELNERAKQTAGLQGEVNTLVLSLAGGAAIAAITNLVTRFGGMFTVITNVVGALGFLSTAMVAAGAAFTIFTTSKAFQAFKEMREAQAQLRKQAEDDQKYFTERLRNLKESGDLVALERQATTALNAERSKGKDASQSEIAFYERILRAIETQGASIVSRNQLETQRLETLRKQTAELEKQAAEVTRRSSLLAETSKKFKKEQLKGDDPENRANRVAILTGDKSATEQKLAQVNAKLDKGVSSSDPLAQKVGVMEVFKALLQEQLELQTQLLVIDKDLTDEKLAQEKAFQKAVDKAIDEADERRKSAEEQQRIDQASIETTQRLAQLRAQANNESRRGDLAAQRKDIEANVFLLELDRRQKIIAVTRSENVLIQERINFLKAELALNASKPAVDDKDRLQNLQNTIQLQKEINDLTLQLGENVRSLTTAQIDLSQQLNISLVQWSNNLGTTTAQVANILTSTLGTAISSISEQMTELIFQTTTWGDAWRSVVSAVLRGLVQMLIQFGLQQAAMFIIRTVYGKAALATAATEATAAAAIWAPAATAASIATFGGAAGVGTAAFLAALAVGTSGATAIAAAGSAIGGKRTGGYTGDGSPDEASGHFTHKKEFVLPEDVTSRVGVARLYRFMSDVRFGKGNISLGGGVGGGARISSPVVGSAPSVNVGAAPVNVVLLKDPREVEKYLQSSQGRSVLFDIQRQQKYEAGG